MNYGKTEIVVCENADDLGRRSAEATASILRRLLSEHGEVRMVLAAGESQMTFLDALAATPDIDWGRIVCFNVDDFWDPTMPEEFSCGYQTRVQLYDKVNPGAFHLVHHNAPDPDAEAARFEELLRRNSPIHVLSQGIGTSGHLALNEPGATDFEDPAWVRVVELSEQSKRQLREDPNFKGLGYIPSRGITMTIPAILSAGTIFTIVPLGLKREILTRLLATANPTSDLPASILSTVEGTLFVDRDSAPPDLPGSR